MADYVFEYKKMEDFGYYVVYINGELIFNYSIDKLPNGKFGLYDGYEEKYLIENQTLKSCKKEFECLFRSDRLYRPYRT